jgi:hypothetical protein
MSWTIPATVVNSQKIACQIPIEMDGEQVTATFVRTIVEATPDDVAGKTLTFALPQGAVDDIPDGAKLSVTIEVVEA